MIGFIISILYLIFFFYLVVIVLIADMIHIGVRSK